MSSFSKCIIALWALIALLTIGLGYKAGVKNSVPDEPRPVEIRLSLYHNPDSLAYYAALAYKDEDPKGLYVTGVASYLALFDEWPDSLTTVSYEDEGWLMIWRAAQLNYPDAVQLIHCMSASGIWNHSIPEPLEK